MSQDLEITIINGAQIRYAFQQSPRLARKYIPDAINQSLLTVGAAAARNAPVRTGNLRSSILDPNRGLVLASPGVFRGSVGSGVGYGGFVERGTRFMRAQPFLGPAVKKSRSAVKEFFTEAVEKITSEIARAA